MRLAALLLPALVLLAAVAPPGQAIVGLTLTHGAFVEGGRVFSASATYEGPCSGIGTLTVVIHKPSGADTRVAVATSTMFPDPCADMCDDCAAPFTWVLRTAGTLIGAGVHGAGPVDALAGTFQGGVLTFHHRPAA